MVETMFGLLPINSESDKKRREPTVDPSFFDDPGWRASPLPLNNVEPDRRVLEKHCPFKWEHFPVRFHVNWWEGM